MALDDDRRGIAAGVGQISPRPSRPSAGPGPSSRASGSPPAWRMTRFSNTTGEAENPQPGNRACKSPIRFLAHRTFPVAASRQWKWPWNRRCKPVPRGSWA